MTERCDPKEARGRLYRCGLDANPEDVASPEGSALVCFDCVARVLVLVEEHAGADAKASLVAAVNEGIEQEGTRRGTNRGTHKHTLQSSRSGTY